MLLQILIHTPYYVWIILALLIYRGVLASTDREMAFGKLFIIPVIMPLLTLPDLAMKFGHAGPTFASWATAAAIGAAITFRLSGARVSLASKPGKVLVRGSWSTLVLLMAVFLTKYAANIMLAVSPQVRHDSLFIAVVCALYGLLNGIFFGRLARDTAAYRLAGPAMVA
jgi:hypothetical protein